MAQPIPQIVPRQKLLSTLDTHCVQAIKHKRDLGLLFCDITQFGQINAEYGYDVGDQILFDVFERMQEFAKSDGLLARTGPSEFALILPFLPSSFVSHLAARKVISALGEPYRIQDHQISLNIFVGVGLLDMEQPESSGLCLLAESALREARQQSNPYAIWYAEQKESLEYCNLEDEIKYAIENDGLELFYQPQIDLATGKPCSAEVLLRFKNRAGENIPPDIFIPISEKSDLIHQITKWTLHNSLRLLKEMNQSREDFGLSVNISGACFGKSYLVDLVSNALGIWDVDPKLLTLEITETVFMADLEATRQICSELRDDVGVKISIDDFGTGFCSLEYFKKIPADEIKIDQSFVRNITNDPADRHIVDMIVKLAHGVGLSVVAEGIEDQDTLKTISSLECDIAQGYYINRPEKGSVFTSFLDTFQHAAPKKLIALGLK